MRFLIVAAVLACASAAPSGVLAPYGLGLGHGLVGHGAPLAVAHAAPGLGYAAPGLGYAAHGLAHAAVPVVAAPTISPGDIQGAQIEAHVDAHDHARAAVDAAREQHDQVSELHGQAVNAAEDHAWAAVDAAKTHEAQLDGAAAGAAPIIAKQIAYSAPAVGYAAPAIGYAGHAVAGPALGYAAQGYAAPGLGYAASGLGYAGHGYAGHGLAASKTVVHQSLSQSHPAPLVHAAPIAHGYAAPLAHGYAAPLAGGYAHGW